MFLPDIHAYIILRLYCFIFLPGIPTMFNISQNGDNITCNVNSTSQPESYKTNMLITFTVSNGTDNYTIQAQDSNLLDLSMLNPGVLVSCTGRENGSTLVSDRSNWINVTADTSSRLNFFLFFNFLIPI